MNAGVYEFYNVMWIDYEYNVASRRALGRITKEYWDHLQLDRVEVIIG